MSDVELTLAVHVERLGSKAVRLSETGDDQKACWVPRSLISSFERTGKSTRGFDGSGNATFFELADVTMAEWKAKELGWI